MARPAGPTYRRTVVCHLQLSRVSDFLEQLEAEANGIRAMLAECALVLADSAV